MRKLTAVLAGILLALALVGCTSSDSDEEGVSTEADRASSESGSQSGASSEDDSSSGDGSSSGDATDSSDLSDVLGEDASNCLEVSLAYGSIYLSALGLGSEGDRAEIERQIEEIRGKVPEDIRDDLQTIEEGLSEADGLAGIGEFFESDEYKQADENITTYLEETCGDVAN
jgi:hypothetical protein